jgi:hypothetical protein
MNLKFFNKEKKLDSTKMLFFFPVFTIFCFLLGKREFNFNDENHWRMTILVCSIINDVRPYHMRN